MDWSDRIGRRIKLRDLHVVLAIAEAGSMAKASQKLSISHPVVSKTISDLERTLGVKLFERTSQGVELTRYGAAMLKCGVNVFDEMRQGLREIEFLTDPTSGELAIGCPEIMNAGIIPTVSERLLRQHPRLQLRVVHADIGLSQFDLLRERKVELLVGRLPDPFVEDDLVFEPLLQEPFVAVVGIDSSWARRRRIELADLMEESWVLPPYDSTPGGIISEIFSASGLKPPRPSIATLSIQLTTTLIATGKFVGILPNSVAQFSARRVGLKLLPAKIPLTHYAIAILTLKNRTPGPLAKLFIEHARTVAKSLST
ncbi:MULTISPECIES: LysR family transcriptional regulator [Bradyrhizobium]|jgi:DNA-binding transcriptional LysR family regulator|uniref:LysR family transcriptional regulator n=1 Tax=Bradyrhizobium TaxID=374 RepID=UPI0004879D62|nr:MULTISPECIES: LysR family transcriptional regulator [Bradyrhizobium]MCS3452006.1 DNA-binding transcriptional LysR family regulator [Bradyrhizobium elkanii]MCS3565895.1 DNA-binding transcriptional LysR family regulator [Bradyrhizobium elkanii]MCW2153375.1 DNA-binding transcriptional LysR family regulator [Bradyrhizobium elkanii]MCW2356939.1 DNA-binding transcriptional LysR family regulator [Bradyrhizobium elkanii]MCW2377108.1 DNA-binding transcriptional LysR family regulator [Bradyrhizobium 